VATGPEDALLASALESPTFIRFEGGAFELELSLELLELSLELTATPGLPICKILSTVMTNERRKRILTNVNEDKRIET
jgi:hypothetical protein